MAIMRRAQAGHEWSELLGMPRSEEGRTLPTWLLGRRGSDVRVEEYTEDDAYVLRAEIPGVDPGEDVDITVSEGRLSVHAERREQQRQKARGGYRTEFRYGAFSREVALPPGAKEDQAAATYKNGILEVRVPVEPTTEQTTRRIPVESG